MNKLVIVSVVVILLGYTALADMAVKDTRRFTEPKPGLTVVAGTVELPAGGIWSVAELGKDSGLSQIQLELSPAARELSRGDRARKADLQTQIEQERYPLWNLYWACGEYARTNHNVGPDSWENIRTNTSRHITQNFSQATTNYFLIPAVPIQQGGTSQPERLVLALQLHPLVADGKHWVLFNDGQSERVIIDKALCAKYGVTIVPQRAPESTEPKPAPSTWGYVVSALVNPNARTIPVRLTLTNRTSGEQRVCEWAYGTAAEGDHNVTYNWAMARSRYWKMCGGNGDAPILNYWLSRGESLYGAGSVGLNQDQPRGPVENADAFSVLGGRAAVRETLQIRPLRPTSASKVESQVAIETLTGVVVKSHPFDEMLKGVQPGALAMADSVPADRAFVYFPKPETLLPLLNGGADFVFQGGSLASANPAAYDLKQRYVERLALSEQWMRDLLIKSGAVTEMAVLFPDLFFIDGTEVTVLAHIPKARLLMPALGMLGLASLTDTVQEKTGKAGSSFWVLDKDLLIISTSPSEARRILALRKAKGAGSLGQSAEFRYMLSQTPVRAETRCYVYLSDPFIRRLVGPEVKIGQLRRLVAKGEMESLTAAALLYRLDGQAGRPDVPTLVTKGYLAAEPSSARGSTLDQNLSASCPQYGSPARMKTLFENPVTTVTPDEVAAYKAYVDNYSRFWRQYFDPIAFRLDDGPEGELQLTTFILPLIDNSIYNGLKEVMRHKEDGTPLRLPNLTPKPLMLLSLNLSEDSWTKVTREMFSDLLRRYTTLDPMAFDKIGPGVHLAIHDADPIITFGAGDTLGIFGAQTLGAGRQEMLFIPAIASILTRPCQLIVELQDPAAVRRMMLAASSSSENRREGWSPKVSFYKLEGRDSWICAISIENIVNIRFGVEIQGDYLILSNLPWSQKPAFGPTRKAELNAMALDIHPESGILQMPGLYTAACEQERAAAVQGARYLYPLLMCGADSVEGAISQSRALFGFAPEHPGKGQWEWENGRIWSTTYGDASHPVQPEYKAGDRPFGVLAGLDTLNLNLQFEDAGLRVVTRWKMASKETTKLSTSLSFPMVTRR
ncbi:MAG: hypothetical protein WCO42_04045 [bacterium]